MAGYTSEEKQAIIDRFLLGRVTTPRTSLGARDVLAARDDVYSLLTTTLLLKPDSYFYVVWLAKNRLEALRRKQVTDLTYILSASTTAALSRRSRAVRATVDLTNAQAALLNLNTSLNSGVLGAGSRELGPEVTRFRRSIERFVRAELQPNVVESSEITETAGEVRERIRTLWEDVRTRHAEMLELGAAIQDAVPALSRVRLPEKAVRGVVTRLRERLEELTAQLETDKDSKTHREAMLELLVMRTLLTRVSSFRVPQEVLAPFIGDAQNLTGIAGTEPAFLLSTNSGPYNIAPGDNLAFETGSPVVVSNIVFGDYSNAEVRSRSFTTFPVNFAVGSSFRLRVNGTLYPATAAFSGSAYAALGDILTAVQGYLTAEGIPATAFISGTQIVIRSTSAADVSSLEVLRDTADQQLFFAIYGNDAYGVCQPVTVPRIVELGGGFPALRLSEVRTEYGTYAGATAAAALLDLSKVSGNDLAGSGTQFQATSTNFEASGIVAGDYLYIAPQLAGFPFPAAAAEVHRIQTVSGGKLTLETALDVSKVAQSGVSTYRIGADLRAVPAGARAIITSPSVPLNSGPYRVVSSDVGQVTLDRAFFATADLVSVNLFASHLLARAPGSMPADGITAWPASPGATVLGLPVTATQERAPYTEFETSTSMDFLARGVTAGDLLTLDTPVPSETVITGVTLDTLMTEPVDYFSGSVGYTIRSARYVAWGELVDAVTAFIDSVDMNAAEFSVTRLVSGAAPTATVLSALTAYNNAITNLSAIEDYVVPFERTVDNVLKTLVEQGMDRAADLFTTLQIEEFFGMHPDGVSYSSHLIRTTADVTRQVAPVSRFAKSLLGSPEVKLRSRRFSS
jgi:hypothetical protein